VPRLQVYLPDDLHREVKARGLPASELLQAAVRAECRRLDLLAAAAGHEAALADEVGEPSATERDRAELVARRMGGR
jgi:post-segregation antitoxin (ccd killing protein)